MHRGDGAAEHKPGTAAALPHALGARSADSGNRVQRVHDVQAGVGQLGASDDLAGDRARHLFYLQPLPQPSEQSAIARRLERKTRGGDREGKQRTRSTAANRVKCPLNHFTHEWDRKSAEIVLEGLVEAGLGGTGGLRVRGVGWAGGSVVARRDMDGTGTSSRDG